MGALYVSDEIRNFILKRIDSIAQIEALLLIRAEPQERWTARQIAARLYVSEAETLDALGRLCAAELLVFTEERYELDGIPLENARLIGELLAVYTRHLIPVTNIVHGKRGRIGSFADAFRFRKGM